MPRHLRLLSLALLVLCAGVPPAQAALKVLATTPDWGSLVNELGGDKVNVYTATSPFQDVHRVDAKPSLLARARSADLVVVTGADLEIGWMPVLLQDSGNSKIQPGAPGYFEAAPLVPLLEVPSAVDRSMGDIHPLGNPHVTLDAHNIAIIARVPFDEGSLTGTLTRDSRWAEGDWRNIYFTPENLTATAGISDKAQLLGRIDKFELWNPDKRTGVSQQDKALAAQFAKQIGL